MVWGCEAQALSICRTDSAVRSTVAASLASCLMLNKPPTLPHPNHHP